MKLATDVAGLLCGFAFLGALALTEPERAREPQPIEAKPSQAQAPRCAVESRTVEIWYAGGEWHERLVNSRPASEPCWYKAALK